MIDKKYIEPFQNMFREQYETIHRLETNKLRNVAKFFSHLLHTDAISWEVTHPFLKRKCQLLFGIYKCNGIVQMYRYLLYNYILWKTLIVLLLKNFSKSPISFLGDRLNCICLNLWSVKEGFCFVQVLEVIKLNEDDTTSASRIFIKVLFQELSEYLGLPKLNDRLKDP